MVDGIICEIKGGTGANEIFDWTPIINTSNTPLNGKSDLLTNIKIYKIYITEK